MAQFHAHIILPFIFTPPHGSMKGYLVHCVFVCLFFCMVMDFSAAEKARSVKFCTHIGLLSGQVFSPFGEDWLAGSHGGGISSGMNIGIGGQTLHC